MARSFWTLCFVIFTKLAMATVPVNTDIEAFVGKDTVAYWKPHYYDSIAKLMGGLDPSNQSFDQMIGRYKSAEFDYVESLSNQFNFITRVFQRFIRFLEDILPTPPEQIDGFNRIVYDVIYYVLIVIGIILIVYAIYKILFSGNLIFIKHAKEEEEDTAVNVSFVEENLMEVDINKYINQAVVYKKYNLAIRYQHLLNIQQMQKREMLHWQPTKTNMELIASIEREDLKQDFIACAKIYDFVWFGNFSITELDYAKYVAVFDNLRRSWL